MVSVSAVGVTVASSGDVSLGEASARDARPQPLIQPLPAGERGRPLLEVRHATKIYGGGLLQTHERVTALRDLSLHIAEEPATITTIAGESGSGKTTLASAILGFISLTSGQILYRGQDVSQLARHQMITYRREVQAVFQDPYEVYNPFYRVRHVFNLVIGRFKLARDKGEARRLIEDALRVVGLRGDEVLDKYPHQLSGGQRQRMMIARALLLRPRLIVADEPVSMVDASLRAMILDIMLRMRNDLGISFLYITHDLSTAYQISDRTFILYQGSIAECGDTTAVIEQPRHPYVQLLLSSIPVPDPAQRWHADDQIPTDIGQQLDASDGCPFYARCAYHMDRCRHTPPPLYELDGQHHRCACYLCDEDEQKGGAQGDDGLAVVTHVRGG
jgi:oligopeptide/dipeptide ABC transporter ATP-binding protein